MDRCISGKRVYPSEEIAEGVLIEAWTRYDYKRNEGPIAIYKCDDCGQYHLTSKGPMNENLAKALAEGKINKQKEARYWEEKFRRR